MKKIGFICVNYNNSMLSVNYVMSILGLRDIKNYFVQIVIVDNASETEDLTYLKEELAGIANVKVVDLDSNIGYSRALNRGLEILQSESYDYIIAGNNDLFFDRNFLVNLCTNTYSSDVFLIAPDVINIDGIHQNPVNISAVLFPRKLLHNIYNLNYFFALMINIIVKIFKLKQKKYSKMYKTSYIAMAHGSCWIFTKQYLQNIKLLEEIVFMWCEEGILAAQIFANGGKIYFDQNLKIKHFEHSSVKDISSRKKYYLYRSSYWTAMSYMKEKSYFKNIEALNEK